MATCNTIRFIFITTLLLADNVRGVGPPKTTMETLKREIEELRKDNENSKRRISALERFLERQDDAVTFSGKRVYPAAGEMTHVGEKVPIVFSKDLYHINSDYSLTDGKFYCKRGGLYLISVTITAYNDTAAEASLYVNDKKVVTVFSGMNAVEGRPSGTRDIGLLLSAGDKVWVGGENRRYNHHCYFSYVLLRGKFNKYTVEN